MALAVQTIAVYSADAAEYTWTTTITELTGKDISGDTVQICLGSDVEPGTFVAPDRISRPTSSSVVVQLLVGGNGNAGTPYQPIAGKYYVWVFLSDTPEQVPRRAGEVVIT